MPEASFPQEISLREARETAGLSLREAARLLKISHPYLSALELGHKPLREDNEKKIRKLYRIPRDSVVVDVLPEDKEHFSDWLAGQIKWWDSRFVLPMVPAVTSLLSDIYVEPYFRVPSGDVQTSSALLNDFFSDEENYALLVSGGMGSGKSFFLCMLTLQSDRIQRELSSKQRFVPILVSLGDFVIQPGSLVNSLVDYYRMLGFEGSPKKLEQYFRQSIERGDALLMFDGLDEVQNVYERGKMLALLQQYFENGLRKTGNKLIISGQDEALTERDPRYPGFRMVSVEPWSAPQLFEGAGKWDWSERDDAAKFWLVLQSNDRIHQLARWPLLFHLFATLHSAYGLRAFEELSALFDSCCEVLENSWDNARRTLQARARSGGEAQESLAWMKWRHFFIFMMEQSLDRADSDGSIPFSFTSGEMRELWEKFLSSRGMSRHSNAFSRVEDFVRENNRIGPITLRRAKSGIADAGKTEDRYVFLDDSFAEYYAAKALINDPTRIEERISRNLRAPAWENIIPLAIQELCRSDRSFERELGEKLIVAVQLVDDELKLDGTHRIGRFNFFTAVRSVGSMNLERHWETEVRAFLDSYLYAEENSRDGTFDTEFFRIYEILGEFSAWPRVASYLREVYEKHFGSSKQSGFARETKWRLLGAMAKVGEQSEFVVDALIGDIEQFVQRREELTSEERVSIRRLLWAIWACGRVFRRQGDVPAGSSTSAAVPQFQALLRNTFSTLRESFEADLQNGGTEKYHYWHILVMIARNQYMLDYSEDLGNSVEQIFTLIDRNIETIFDNYSNRAQLIQLFKVMSCHTRRLPKPLFHSVYSKLSKRVSKLEESECAEIQVCIELGRASTAGSIDSDLEGRLLEQAHGRPLEKLVENWITAVANYDAQSDAATSIIGSASTGLEFVVGCNNINFSTDRLVSIAKVLLEALQAELTTVQNRAREEDRYYTRAGAVYGLPMYDHLYNCLLAVSRRLPLKTNDNN